MLIAENVGGISILNGKFFNAHENDSADDRTSVSKEGTESNDYYETPEDANLSDEGS